MADHVLDAVAEALTSEYPRDGYRLEEHQEQHRHTASCIIVQDLEDVHPSLCVNSIQLIKSEYTYFFNSNLIVLQMSI